MTSPEKLLNPALSCIERVIDRFKILSQHSGVVVGVSGGRDSLVLLYLLNTYNKKFQKNWKIYTCHIDPGFPHWDTDYITRFSAQLEIPCKIIKTDIAWRIKNLKKKCFFCARERRRQLLQYAESLNVFQIALAHHLEDVVETFLLNIIYNGEISTFIPNQSVIQGRFSFIRPLYYIEKREIDKISSALLIPEKMNICPYYHISKRQRIREFLNEITLEYPDAYRSIFNGIKNIKPAYLPA